MYDAKRFQSYLDSRLAYADLTSFDEARSYAIHNCGMLIDATQQGDRNPEAESEPMFHAWAAYWRAFTFR